MNIKMFAIEYEIEWATPRISFGNSSAVMVHGIVSNPIMEKQTYSNKQRTGTQSWCEVPIERNKKCKVERKRTKKKMCVCECALTKDFWNICQVCSSTIFNPLSECARNEHDNRHSNTRRHNQWSSFEPLQKPCIQQWHEKACNTDENRNMVWIHIAANILNKYEINKK